MKNVIVYSKEHCPYCVQAKKLLESKQIPYQEIRVDLDNQALQDMLTRSQRRTVPQIFIGDYHVGGCDDLYALEKNGKLDELVS